MKILITGVAGFIGFHLASRLIRSGVYVIGIDNLNSYYDVNLKKSRLELLLPSENFEFHKLDISDTQSLDDLCESVEFDCLIHLAAQAGVRYSIDKPLEYGTSNLTGFLNILEIARRKRTQHLIYASSSSVYGANTKLPYSINDLVDNPISLYAATKKANELMAYSYSHLYKIPMTGLRFFTVYGPWGRPDMAYFKFANAIMAGEKIDIYNHGDMRRDFTYIDDIVDGIQALVSKSPDSENNSAPHRIYNLGNSSPEKLLDMVSSLEQKLGKVAEKVFLPMQLGDVQATFADISESQRDFGYMPKTALDVGLAKFAKWFLDYRSAMKK